MICNTDHSGKSFRKLVRTGTLTMVLCILLIPGAGAQKLTHNIDSLVNALAGINEQDKPALLLQIGFEYSYVDSFKTGLNYLKDALRLAEKYKQQDIIAKTTYQLGDLYFQFDDLSNAQIWFAKAYKLSEQLEKKILLVYSSAGLGNVYLVSKDWANASKYLNQALKIASKEGMKHDIPKLLNQLGNMYSTQNLIDSALYYYEALLEAGIDNKDSLMIGFAYTNIASALTEQNRHTEAILLLKKALEISSIQSKSKIEATIFLNLGQSYLALGDYSNALRYLKSTFETTKKQGYLHLQMSSSKYISEVYTHFGDYKTAMEYYTHYSLLKDSIFNIEKQKEFQNLKFKNELEQTEKKLAVMSQKALIKSLSLYFSLFSILLLIIIVIQLYRGFRNKIKIQEMEKFRMEGTIDQQSRDLVSMAMNLSHKQQLMSEIQVSAKHMAKNQDNTSFQGYIDDITGKLKDDQIFEKNWALFMKHFNGVHPSFFNSLQEKHADLTSTEKRYCAFIKLNLSAREIAQIHNITLRSVYMFRYRLKKKLLLLEEDDLDQYIGAFN
jgi:tetratricopeptide (TPR) repeat protein